MEWLTDSFKKRFGVLLGKYCETRAISHPMAPIYWSRMSEMASAISCRIRPQYTDDKFVGVRMFDSSEYIIITIKE